MEELKISHNTTDDVTLIYITIGRFCFAFVYLDELINLGDGLINLGYELDSKINIYYCNPELQYLILKLVKEYVKNNKEFR